MPGIGMLVAVAAILTAGSTAAAAKEAPDRPKERKVCRTVEMSGRITPQRVCRKVKQPAQGEERREPRDSAESPKSAD